jgi:hypothetical protein
LRHRGDEIPFDVKDLRFIEYDLEPRKIFDRDYINILQHYEKELSPSERFEGKVPFAPHLTPLGRGRLNFNVAERYDLLSPQVADILSSAKKRFFFSGLSLRGWIGNEGFISLMQERAQQGVDCRILVMSPDNSAISQMLSCGVSDQEERIKNDIRETYAQLSRLEIKNLEVRLVRRGTIYQQMTMSEHSMIWAPHLYCKQTGQSPAIRVDVTSSQLRQSGLENLYLAMRDEFEQLWYENAL